MLKDNNEKKSFFISSSVESALFYLFPVVQLVGRCETGRNFLEVAEIDRKY